MDHRSHEAVVGDQFNPQAAAYLSSAVHAQGEDLSRLAALIGQRPEAAALDLGCGGGHVAYLLAPLVRSVAAYDLSPAMLAIVRAEATRRGFNNVETRQGSVEQLPWPDGTFDIVVSRFSAHHWHDVDAGLGEARRVLRPGGIAVFMDVVAPEQPLLDTWLQTLELLRDPSHLRDYRVSEWLAMVRRAGFDPGEMSPFRLRLEFSSWVKRMNTLELHVQAIHSLCRLAGADVADHFEMEADGSFTIDTMLLTAAA